MHQTLINGIIPKKRHTFRIIKTNISSIFLVSEYKLDFFSNLSLVPCELGRNLVYESCSDIALGIFIKKDDCYFNKEDVSFLMTENSGALILRHAC